LAASNNTDIQKESSNSENRGVSSFNKARCLGLYARLDFSNILPLTVSDKADIGQNVTAAAMLNRLPVSHLEPSFDKDLIQ